MKEWVDLLACMFAAAFTTGDVAKCDSVEASGDITSIQAQVPMNVHIARGEPTIPIPGVELPNMGIEIDVSCNITQQHDVTDFLVCDSDQLPLWPAIVACERAQAINDDERGLGKVGDHVEADCILIDINKSLFGPHMLECNSSTFDPPFLLSCKLFGNGIDTTMTK